MQIASATRSHRTALVIDARKGFTGKFKERTNRLLESVNGNNIKVDVYTLEGGDAITGVSVPATLTLHPGKPGEGVASSTASGSTDDALEAWANGLGYDMLVVARPPVKTKAA